MVRIRIYMTYNIFDCTEKNKNPHRRTGFLTSIWVFFYSFLQHLLYKIAHCSIDVHVGNYSRNFTLEEVLIVYVV